MQRILTVVPSVMLVLVLATLPSLSAQVPASTEARPSIGSKCVATQETVQQAFQREQQSLAQDMETTLSIDPAQLETWRVRNVARLAAQQDRAKLIAAESALAPMPEPPLEPIIPADASPALKEFLITRAKLVRSQVQIHNELLDALPQEVTAAQVEEMQKKEAALFLQLNEKDLEAQTQRAKAMAAESARSPHPALPPLNFPPEAAPEIKAFLTVRHQIMREQIEIWNRNPDPDARNQAMRERMKQNTKRLEQVRVLATRSSINSAKKNPR